MLLWTVSSSQSNPLLVTVRYGQVFATGILLVLRVARERGLVRARGPRLPPVTRPLTTCRHQSPPVTTRHQPSPPVTTPLTTSHHLSPPISSGERWFPLSARLRKGVGGTKMAPNERAPWFLVEITWRLAGKGSCLDPEHETNDWVIAFPLTLFIAAGRPARKRMRYGYELRPLVPLRRGCWGPGQP